MLTALKRHIKKVLQYRPLLETADVRAAIETVSVEGLPYCPPEEGDLLFSLIRSNGYKKCLETGFHTGSTALYMAAALGRCEGTIVSICLDNDEGVERGLNLLRTTGFEGRHQLVRANSNKALSEMFLAEDKFDFIFMDGWKTFDHLAFEMYLFNQLLETGGVIAFDDSYMPSVRKAIALLNVYYGYQEVDYASHGQTKRLRLLQMITRRSPRRPYRAFKKIIETDDQKPFLDWNFYRPL